MLKMQDDETCEVVPGTDFIVSRTAHRNNSSVYYIGSRKSSFGEVTDLLKGKGIDLDNNRFLILQVSRCLTNCKLHNRQLFKGWTNAFGCLS